MDQIFKKAMINLSIKDIECYMPENIVFNDYFGDQANASKNIMFSGTKERRHFKKGELASDHMALCAQKLIENNELDAKENIDMIVSNVSCPDQIFTGAGAIVNKKIKANAKYIFDLHNTGCVSFIYMLDLVKTYMIVHGVKSALICNSQTSGGRIFGQDDTRQLAQSCIPGDGTSVAYITNDSQNLVSHIKMEIFPEFAEDMYANYGEKSHWERRDTTGCIDFTESKSAEIITRGNRMVPKMIYDVCDSAKIKTTAIDYLITNQPNKIFLRNWREAAQLTPDRHLDTFDQYANLFGAGIPVTLSENMKKGTFKKGDLICLAGFSHAGDFAASCLVNWG